MVPRSCTAISVHSTLGPGLREDIYEKCLKHELSLRGLKVETQVLLPIEYKGLVLEGGLRLDILVEGTVIVELKVIEAILPVHESQLLTYLKLSGKRVGLILNFNSALMKDGIKRMAL
jgi:GxxExxY protein